MSYRTAKWLAALTSFFVAFFFLFWLSYNIDYPETVKVVYIHDGDTFFVDLPNTRPIFGKRIGVRIRGIDTPELNDKREDVKEKARQAKMFLVEKLRSADEVDLRNWERGKFFRIVADVYVDGVNLGDLLLSKGLAKEYDGTGKKPEWGD